MQQIAAAAPPPPPCAEAERPCSTSVPLAPGHVPPPAAAAGGMSKFSLLGQQLHYASPQQHQHQHQHQQQQQQQQQPRSGLNFSLGAGQALPFSPQQARGHGGSFQSGLAFGMGSGFGPGQEMLDADGGGGGSYVARIPLQQQQQQGADLMSTLGIIHQGIGQVQALLPLMAPAGPPNSALAHQQAATAQRLAAVISQLAMAAAAMLPVVQQQAMQPGPDQQLVSHAPFSAPCYSVYQGLGSSPLMSNSFSGEVLGNAAPQVVQVQVQQQSNGESGGNNNGVVMMGGQEEREEEEELDGDSLPAGSYELIEMEAVEILAEHTHFCEICGKGFKRDANLRMHMRGHGDEYKTPAALARPEKGGVGQEALVSKPRRYSCPCVGCKRNRKHRKFQPLKTMLCVKNHYRRSHCPKSLVCAKCKCKKFSVMADLKTHEKHCGRDKWQCSCGTTFSRKDKLFGHIGLFQGHTPAMPLHDMDAGSIDSALDASNAYPPPLGPITGSPYVSSSTTTTTTTTPTPGTHDDSQSAGSLLQGSPMLHGLFTSNFASAGPNH